MGDATLLPGFIELHAHLSFQNVPADTVLKHGDHDDSGCGRPLHKPYGGDGNLRVLTSGPILTAPGGYPIPMMGETDIAIPVSTVEEARATVRKLINEGAAVIKIALEPGGEAGAPWSSGHGMAMATAMTMLPIVVKAPAMTVIMATMIIVRLRSIARLPSTQTSITNPPITPPSRMANGRCYRSIS